jgi:hypothetical protein
VVLNNAESFKSFNFGENLADSVVFQAVKTNLQLIDLDLVKTENLKSNENYVTPHEYYINRLKLKDYPESFSLINLEKDVLLKSDKNESSRFSLIKNLYNSNKLLSVFEGKLPMKKIDLRNNITSDLVVNYICNFEDYIKFFRSKNLAEIKKYTNIFDYLPFIAARNNYKLVKRKRQNNFKKLNIDNPDFDFEAQRYFRKIGSKNYLILAVNVNHKVKKNVKSSYMFAKGNTPEEFYYIKESNQFERFLNNEDLFVDKISKIFKKTETKYCLGLIPRKVDSPECIEFFKESLMILGGEIKYRSEVNNLANKEEESTNDFIMKFLNDFLKANIIIGKNQFNNWNNELSEKLVFRLNLPLISPKTSYEINWSKQKALEEGFIFSVEKENTVIKKYLGFNSNVVIPSTIEFKPVLIKKGAFQFNKVIENLYFSDNIKIESHSFSFCPRLSNVWIGFNTTKDGEIKTSEFSEFNSFYNSSKDVNFYISDTTKQKNNLESWTGLSLNKNFLFILPILKKFYTNYKINFTLNKQAKYKIRKCKLKGFKILKLEYNKWSENPELFFENCKAKRETL